MSAALRSSLPPARRWRPTALGASFALALTPVLAGAAPRALRDLDVHGLELSLPLGLAHDPATGGLLLLQRAPGAAGAELVALTTHGDVSAVAALGGELSTALAVTFDPASGLLVVLSQDGALSELGRGSAGLPDPGQRRPLGAAPAAATAGGLAADPATGQLLFLDGPRRRVLRLAPESGEAAGPAVVGRIELAGVAAADAGLLAFHPGLRHLFLLAPSGRRLVELSEFGEHVAEHDVSAFELVRPRALVFAPSADQTDDPATLHLYVADAGPAGRSDEGGRILEASLAAPASASLAVASEPATLVRVIQGTGLNPPSPDSSGLAWNPTANRLLMSDGEVEEYSYFAGANVWELELGGTQRGTRNTTPFSNEPTGVAFNSADGHLFFSDDDADKIYEARVGTGGVLQLVRQLNTGNFGIGDPEGVAYDSLHHHMYVADGINAEVYRIARGPDGVFDGDDETSTHFDVAALGLLDPESVEYNAVAGTLFVVDHASEQVLETTTSGAPLRSIDIAFLNSKKAAGLAFAPGSNDAGAMHLYIADRGTDSASPIDGKIYEIAFGSTAPPPPPPPPSSGLDVRVAAAADDAEESATGTVNLGSADLDLVRDGANQTVAMRFLGLQVPRGANVTSAWLQFTADETASEATPLTIRGQLSGNAPAFTTGAANLSLRPPTGASVGWSPPSWNTVGEAGAAQRTPDLSAVIEEIVARSDWTSGNALALLVTGSGLRVAESFEGGASLAALLHVEIATVPVCGNGVRETGEACDGASLGGGSCADVSCASGTPTCTASCTLSYASCGACTVCGNGVREAGEQCDGANLGGAACSDVGCGSGSPACTASCTLSYASCSACSVCGNGVRETGEQCDGLDLGGASCTSRGFYCSVGGGLACATDCRYDSAECISGSCGDGVTQGVCGESCDGTDVGGETCVSQGFGSGTLRCRTDCSDLDLSQCSVCDLDGRCEIDEDCDNCPSDCFGTGPACGNGVCETAEGEDCVSCARDCRGVQSGKPSGRFCCGDGAGRNPIGCGDARCTANGFTCDPAPVPTSCCGNLACEVPEDAGNCAIDCS